LPEAIEIADKKIEVGGIAYIDHRWGIGRHIAMAIAYEKKMGEREKML